MPTVVAVFVLVGCGAPAWRVRAVPREELHLPRIEPSVVLEPPPPGTVVPAQLGHGVPLLRRDRDGFVPYDVRGKLEAPNAGGTLSITPPPDLARWDPTQPPRVPLCP